MKRIIDNSLVVARKLASEFAHIVVFIVGGKNQIKGNALKNLNLLSLYPVEIIQFNTINRVVLSSLLEADVIIDVEERSVKAIVKELITLLDLKKEKKATEIRTDS